VLLVVILNHPKTPKPQNPKSPIGLKSDLVEKVINLELVKMRISQFSGKAKSGGCVQACTSKERTLRLAGQASCRSTKRDT